MDISEKLSIVETFLGSPKRIGNEYLYYCPFCNHHKRKLSLNFEKGKYKCWICDVSGNIRKLVKRKASYETFLRWKKVDGIIDITVDLESLISGDNEKKEENYISMPEHFCTLTSNKKSLGLTKPLNYLRSRGLDAEDILYWKIGFCTDGDYKGRVIIPSFGITGVMNYFVGRSITREKYGKYMNPTASKDIIFNELYVDFDSDIIITEGVFDAIKSGKNSIPLLGSTIREESRLFQKIIKYDSTVFLALDADAKEKENSIMKTLVQYDIEIYKINISPYKDVGVMDKQEFQRRKQEATLITRDKLLEMEMGI